MRLGAITLRELRGIDAVGLWMQKPVVQSALRYEENFHVPDEAEARLKACKRYLKRAEHSKKTLDEEQHILLDTTASSLTPRLREYKPKQWVRFVEGFSTWEILDGQSRNDFLDERVRWLQLIWLLKEEVSRQHHAHVLESEPPHLDGDMIDPS
jgi:predicted Ser/Thr protein kinase